MLVSDFLRLTNSCLQGLPSLQLVRTGAWGHRSAYVWNRQLIAGDGTTMTDIAKETGLTQHSVARIVQLTFLAPDIVEAIIEGSQPRTLTLTTLVSHVPLGWIEQRRFYGFTP